jgi:hypothetical protein
MLTIVRPLLGRLPDWQQRPRHHERQLHSPHEWTQPQSWRKHAFARRKFYSLIFPEPHLASSINLPTHSLLILSRSTTTGTQTLAMPSRSAPAPPSSPKETSSRTSRTRLMQVPAAARSSLPATVALPARLVWAVLVRSTLSAAPVASTALALPTSSPTSRARTLHLPLLLRALSLASPRPLVSVRSEAERWREGSVDRFSRVSLL